MNGIGDFLKKYLDFAPPTRAAQRAVVRAVEERFNTTMNEGDVVVRDGSAFVHTHSALKSEIALNKSALLVRVGEILGSKTVTDIR